MATRPPRLQPSMSPKRTPPPQEEEQVEMRKIDPKELLSKQVDRKNQPVGTTSEHLIPMEFKSAPTVKEEQQDESQAQPQYLPPPPEEGDPLEKAISNRLIDRLSERFKLAPGKYKEAVLTAGNQEVSVALRRPSYDDVMWTLGILEQKIKSNIDTSLMMGEHQQAKYMQHHIACRTVVKIDGEWVWDIFEMTDSLKQDIPGWDGTTYASIPDSSISAIALGVYNLFRSLHADLLFELNNAVNDAFPVSLLDPDKNEEEEESKEDASETPTSAT